MHCILMHCVWCIMFDALCFPWFSIQWLLFFVLRSFDLSFLQKGRSDWGMFPSHAGLLPTIWWSTLPPPRTGANCSLHLLELKASSWTLILFCFTKDIISVVFRARFSDMYLVNNIFLPILILHVNAFTNFKCFNHVNIIYCLTYVWVVYEWLGHRT